MADISHFLKMMVDKNASDLFFSVGSPAHIKIEGLMTPLGRSPLKENVVREIVYNMMNEEQRVQFQQELEMNFGFTAVGKERFRVNVFKQRGFCSFVIRYIKGEIPNVKQLGLPDIIKDLVMSKHGLILVVGSTGSGKSSTLASMIDYRNEHSSGHILTIEDPVEFVHPYKLSLVDQREVGTDTHSFGNALENALREAPDVIMLGEIRDRSAMNHVISYAKSGHLCLSTLHANNCTQAIERVLGFFQADIHKRILIDLSMNLVAIISQRLVIGKNMKRIPAVEVLKPTPFIRELIEKGKIDDIPQAMTDSDDKGIITFDKCLFDLVKEGKISQDEALYNVDSNSDLALQMRLDDEDDDEKENKNPFDGFQIDESLLK